MAIFDLLKQKGELDKEDLRKLGIKESGLEEMLAQTKNINEQLNKKINLPDSLQFINNITDEYTKKKYLQAISENKIDELINSQGLKAALILNTSEDINKELGKTLIEYSSASDEVKNLGKELNEVQKTQFNLTKGLEKWVSNFANEGLKAVLAFDDAIHEGQKDSGIMFAQNAGAMSSMAIEGAKFGMSIKDIDDLMIQMGDTLNTTNFSVLGEAAKDLLAVQMATGISTQNLGAMAGELTRMGYSAESLKDYIVDANVAAKMFGVNPRKVMEDISKNLVRFRSMGFSGGEESLKRMVVTANRLGQSVDEVMNATEKAQSVEGAIEIAAAAQLAGFQANPMDLLATARTNPAEFQKILNKMGSELGKFDKLSGNTTFTIYDTDRLKILAKETGESIDKIQARIIKANSDNQKINLAPQLKFEGLIYDKKPIDPEGIKHMLTDSFDIKGDVIKGSFFGEQGIKNLAQLSQKDLERIIKEKLASDANIEKQARENESLTTAFTALKNTFLQLLTVFQPVIKGLTSALQFLADNKLTGAITLFVLSLPLLAGMLGKLVFTITNFGQIFRSGSVASAMRDVNAKKVGGGIEETIKDSVSKRSKRGAKPIKDISEQAEVSNNGGGFKDFMTNMSAGLKQFDNEAFMGLLRLSGAIVIMAAAFWLVAKMISSLSPTELITGGIAIAAFASSMYLASNFKIDSSAIEELAMAMGLIGIAMIPFAIAMKIMEGVSWTTLGIAGAAILGLTVFLGLLGASFMSGVGEVIIGGVGALIAIAEGLAIVGLAFIPFAIGMKVLADVNWGAFDKAAPALLALSGALLDFSIAGLVFAFGGKLGVGLMLDSLLGISAVVIPLSNALDLGGKGLTAMAQGVLTLSDTLNKLDFDKLEKLKDISSQMVSAASSSSTIDAMNKLANALSGGNSASNKSSDNQRPIEVVVKLNGLDIARGIQKSVDKVAP